MGILGNYLPNWLPEDPNQNAAARQGLMAFGAGLLGGRGDLGGILGDGLMAGTQTYNGALAQQQQTALRQAQLDQTKLENTKLQAAADKPMQLQRILTGGAPSQPNRLAGLPKIGDPPRAAAPAQTAEPMSAPSAAGASTDLFSTYLSYGDRLTQAGYPTEAKQYYDLAEKLRPKLMKRETLLNGTNPVSILTYEDGTEAPSKFNALPDNQIVDMGGTQEIFDKNLPRDGKQFKKTATPDTLIRAAQDERESRRVDERVRAAAVPAADGMLPDETVAMMAEQYRAGDTSVMQNLGRGAQGAQNIIRLRNEIARQTVAAGQGGRDLAAQNAEYFGTKAGQRSAGTRIANVEMASYEAESLIPLARDASAAVSRSGLLPFGKGQVMFNEQTNDPAMRQFAAANNALVNVYSRAISPSGVPTVADKEHAREMIATAMDDKSYQAVLNQMQKEITAARQAPQQVRRAFNDAVTGKGDHGPIKDVKDLPKKAAQQTYADPAKEQRYQEWKRSQGK